jgi:hypothetical protein
MDQVVQDYINILPKYPLALKILSLKEETYYLYKRGLKFDVLQVLALCCLLSNSYKELSKNIGRELYFLDKYSRLYPKIKIKKRSYYQKYDSNKKHTCDCCGADNYIYRNKYGYNYLCRICYNRLYKQQKSKRNIKMDCECCGNYKKNTMYFQQKIADKYNVLCNDCYLKLVKDINKNKVCKICGWVGVRHYYLCPQHLREKLKNEKAARLH